jgi:DNA-binding IclR family transcriptional regulator
MTDDRLPIGTIETSFEVLEILVEEGSASLSELSDRTGRPKSTVHDHLSSLRSLGYVLIENDEYRVSTKLLDMGESARRKMDLFPPAKAEVDELAREVDEHASLAIEEQGRTVLLYISKGKNALDLGVSEGFRMRMPTNAPGKAILANLPEERVEAILDEWGMPELTDRTVTDRGALFEQLEEIRERGYATDLGERVEGVRAVAVPIIVDGDVRGALAISGPANRMEGERFRTELPKLLREAANVVEIQYTLET